MFPNKFRNIFVVEIMFPSLSAAGVSWKTKVKSVFGKLGKCCFNLQYFLYNIDNDKIKQKHTQSHSSYKIETSHFGIFQCFQHEKHWFPD